MQLRHLVLLAGTATGLAACTTSPQEQAAPPSPGSAATPAAVPLPAAAANAAAVLKATPLQTRQVGTAELLAAAGGAQLDTIQGRFLQITAPDSLPRLLYRPTPHDTVWTELLLEAPDGLDEGASATQSTIAFSLNNLDQRGQPELLVTVCQSDVGGNGGREDWCWVNLLDLTGPPRLLLSAGTSSESEAYAGYAGMHGTKLDPDQVYQGCTRRISMHHHELLIGPVKTHGQPGSCPLETLVPGRYLYQGGQMVRVGR